MKKIYFSLLVLTMMMVSTIAKAQYTVNVTSDPEDNYFSGYQAFDPTEIATALGTDTATLHQLITAGEAVYIQTADGSKSNTYTGNTNEFWMNTDGQPQGYGDDGTCWYAGISYDAGGQVDEETGEVSKPEVDVAMGQMPKFFNKVYTDSDLKATFYLVNGEKEISFDITLHVNAAPEVNVPEPTKSFSALQVVKEYAATLEYVEGKEYGDFKVEVNMADIYDAIGLDSLTLKAGIQELTFSRNVVKDESDSYSFADSLLLWNNNDGWYGRYSEFNEASGEETVLTQNASHGWGTGATYYIHDIALANGIFSFLHGQMPGTLKADDKDFTELFIINGTKAAKLTLTVSVTKPESVPFEQMTKVGEQTVEVTSPANNDYSTKTLQIDMEALTAALGCTGEDIEDFYAWRAEGELSNDHTTSGSGYYFNQNGYIDTWANKSPVYIDPSSLADGKYGIGQYAGIYSDITEPVVFKTQLIYMYGDKYYAVNVIYTVNPPKQSDVDERTLVSEETLSIQIVPSSEDWAWGTKTTLDLEYIKGKIGTDDFKLFTDKVDSTGVLQWSSNYTCTPNPGFWYGTTTYENEEHQVVVDNAGWGTNSFGLTYADGEITWYQYPGQRAAGDSFMANLYLSNEDTGDYMKYTLYVKYVEEVAPEAEIKATEEVSFLISDEVKDEDGYYVVSIDMTTAYDSLGISDELIEACSVIAPKSQTIFETTSTEEALFYTVDGYVVSEEDESAIFSASVVVNDEGKPVIMIDDFSEFFNQEKASAFLRIGLEYDGQRYLHIIKLANYQLITVTDITDLIDEYLNQSEGDSTITVDQITDLIDQYLQQ